MVPPIHRLPWKVVNRMLELCECDLKAMCRLMKTSRFLRMGVAIHYQTKLHEILRRQGVVDPEAFLQKLDLYQALLSGPDMLDVIFEGSVPTRKFTSRLEIHIPCCPGYLRDMVEVLGEMQFNVQH